MYKKQQSLLLHTTFNEEDLVYQGICMFCELQCSALLWPTPK